MRLHSWAYGREQEVIVNSQTRHETAVHNAIPEAEEHKGSVKLYVIEYGSKIVRALLDGLAPTLTCASRCLLKRHAVRDNRYQAH